MSWLNFNESLSNIRGQLSNLASGVLSDNLDGETGDHGKKEDKLEELEKLIVAQENEIRELRKLNSEMQEKSSSTTNVKSDSPTNKWAWEAEESNPNDDTIRNLKQQIQELENEKKDLIISLQQLDLDCQQTTERVIVLKDALQVEHSNLQEKYNILVEDYKKHKEDDARVIENFQQKINELEGKLGNGSDDKIKTIENLLKQSALEKDKLLSEIDLAKKKILDYESKIENYQAGRISDQEEYDKLCKILQGYEDHVRIYKEKCIKLESEINMSKVTNNSMSNNDSSYIIQLNDTFKQFMDYPLPIDTTYETQSFSSTVEAIMKHLLEFKYKTDTLEKQVESLLDEKSFILKEKNEEIEKLLDNSELLSQEIIDKNEALKHYEEERRELMKNNDLLITELEEFRNNTGLHTISESNEDNLILMENQLDTSNKKIEELQAELNETKQQYTSLQLDYDKLSDDHEKMKESYSQCYTEKESLNDTVDKIQTDYENTEHKYTEINIGMETLKEETENLQVQIDSLVKKNKKLQHDNLKYQGENEISQSEIDDLKQTLSVELQTREELENEILSLKEKLQNIKMSETALKLQYDRDLQSLHETNSKFEELSKAYTGVQETLEKLNFERTELNIQKKLSEESYTKSKQELEGKIINLKTLLSSNESESEKKLLEANELLEKVKFEYAELSINYKALEEEYENVKTTLNEKIKNIQSKDAFITKIQDEITTLKQENEQFQTFKNQFLQLTKEKSELETKLKNYEELLNNTTNENQKIAELQQKFKDDLEKLERKNKHLQEINEKLKADILNKEKQIDVKDDIITEIQNELIKRYNEEESLKEAQRNEDMKNNSKKEYEKIIADLRDNLKLTESTYSEKIKTLETAFSELTLNNKNLIASLTAKHEESHQYYVEIQRLNQILAGEVEKTRKITDEVEINAQTQELKAKIDSLNEEIEKLNEQNSFLKSKCDVLGQTLLEEKQNSAKLMEEVANATSEKEISLSKELQRLRAHLLEIEDQHTQEIMLADKRATEMQAKMAVLEQREKETTSLHTSVNIRTNQHVETLQNQLQLVTNQRDELRKKMSDAEDTINKQSAGLANLEFVLRQFQEDKEKGIQLETERIRKQILLEKNAQDNLKKELACLRNQLDESKQGLLAAARLSDQMEATKHQIVVLKDENDKLREKLRKTEDLQNASGGPELKVDKMLIKNLVVGFITSNNMTLNKDQHQILKIISTVLDFNQQDNEKVKLNKSNQGSWLSSILHPNVLTQNQDLSQESLSQAFVKFLENESKPRQLPKLLNADVPLEQPGTPQPLLLNEVVLPTFADFGQNRNSSSILKDVLKDNNN